MENQEPLPESHHSHSNEYNRHETAHPFNAQNLGTLKGRMGRLDFVVLSMSLFLVTLLLQKILGINPFILGASAFTDQEIITKELINFGIVISSISLVLFALLSVKRFHDINYSGAMALIFFAPLINLGILTTLLIFIGIIIRLILFFAKGEANTNRYGPIPDGNKRNKLFLCIGIIILVFFTYSNLYQDALPIIEPILQQLIEEMQQQ